MIENENENYQAIISERELTQAADHELFASRSRTMATKLWSSMTLLVLFLMLLLYLL